MLGHPGRYGKESGESGSGVVMWCWCRVLQTLAQSINSVLNAIDKASAERDSTITKFCQSLDKDIAELGRELKEIKSHANVCLC